MPDQTTAAPDPPPPRRRRTDPNKFPETYWRAWWLRASRKQVRDDITATCVRCGVTRVLCEDLFFRGATEPENLLCDDCYYEEGK